MLKTETYLRKPFKIEAIKVTDENIDQVAKWCGGEVKEDKRGNRTVKFIYLDVPGASTERQKKAMIGEWVLRNRKSFKMYTNKAFEDCFEKPSDAQSVNQDELPFEGPISDTDVGRELQERYAAGRI